MVGSGGFSEYFRVVGRLCEGIDWVGGGGLSSGRGF